MPRKDTLKKISSTLDNWVEMGYVKHWMVLGDVVLKIKEDIKERQVNE